jgi:hypothetical protein
LPSPSLPSSLLSLSALPKDKTVILSSAKEKRVSKKHSFSRTKVVITGVTKANSEQGQQATGGTAVGERSPSSSLSGLVCFFLC